MRILLLATSYHPVLGGLQTVTRQLAKSLRSAKNDVRVVTNRHPRRLPARESVDGVEVNRWLFLPPARESARRGRWDLALAAAALRRATWRHVERLVGRFEPDVVNLHFPDSRMLPLLDLRRRMGFRLVVSLHGNDVERWRDVKGERPAHMLDLCQLLRASDGVTTCSRYLLQRAIELEPSIASRARAVYNGIDESRFELAQPYAYPRPYLFAFGRHTYTKGFDLLLRAFAVVADQTEADLLLAGEGEQHQELVALRSSLGLERRVILCGRRSPQQIAEMLRGCRFSVIPSREEPFGIAAVEAFLSGRPVVATRVAGLPEVLGLLQSVYPEGAVYWAAAEPEDLAAALGAALRAPYLAHGAFRLPTALSPETMAASYLSSYRGEADPAGAASEFQVTRAANS